jgi:hypothetical protein
VYTIRLWQDHKRLLGPIERSSSLKRLSSIDTFFLALEDGRTVLNVSALAILG